MKECKHFGLKASRRAKRHALLSGVVHVVSQHGVGVAYITFSETFVDAVGRALPTGLAPWRPAHLKAMQLAGRKTWRVYARYLREEVGTLLFEYPDTPPWLGEVRYT